MCSEIRFVQLNAVTHFISMAGWFCPIICIFVFALPPEDDDYSKRVRLIKSSFRNRSQRQNIALKQDKSATNHVSGGGDFGKIQFVMNNITPLIWITCITIRSSMGLQWLLSISHALHFTNWLNRVFIRKTGAAAILICRLGSDEIYIRRISLC